MKLHKFCISLITFILCSPLSTYTQPESLKDILVKLKRNVTELPPISVSIHLEECELDTKKWISGENIVLFHDKNNFNLIIDRLPNESAERSEDNRIYYLFKNNILYDYFENGKTLTYEVNSKTEDISDVKSKSICRALKTPMDMKYAHEIIEK